MTNSEMLPATVLDRKAVVYVRQSCQTQVETNLEGRRRQYELVEVARRQGFRTVEVIDDDLGRSASGMVARPGFERLVAALCAGEIGAVLCFDASRLARNGRDWHHLLELCGLVEARVIDLDGVYDPCRPNDRLLLGMKGSISEFELGILRARMLDAARSKAERGELRISVPVGYLWHREHGLGFDPDLRLQQTIRLIFERFRQLGSARQTLLSLAADGVSFPRPSDGRRMTSFEWTPIRYRNVISILKNPFYAGAYVYGKSEKRVVMVEGRARKTYGHGRPRAAWDVLIRDHHDGYIGWAEFERNQETLAANTYGWAGGAKSGRGGRALLAGILTCGRCGRAITVSYAGRPPGRPTYRCERGQIARGLDRCMTFGGSRVDAAIAAELLRVVEPMAIEAAREAERMHEESEAERRRMAELDLQQARYDASLAERRYAACDPDNRLIAAQLERAWEMTLRRVEACVERLDALVEPEHATPAPDFTGTRRRSRDRLDRARRHDARTPAAPARSGDRHHRRRRRGGARGHPDHPLARRPALSAPHPQAEDRRAWLPDAGGSARGHGADGGPLVGHRHRRLAQPDGHPHGTGKNLDAPPRRLDPQGPRHARLPLRREERRVAHHDRGRDEARRDPSRHPQAHQGARPSCGAGRPRCTVSDPRYRP